MQIRAADRDDIPRLLPLIRQYWEYEGIDGYEPVAIEALVQQLMERHLGAVWVAESEGRLAGYLAAVFLLSLEHRGMMAEIDELFVVEGERQRGIGARLLAVAEEALAARGCVRVQLQLGAENAPAHALYERCGYRSPAARQQLEKSLIATA
jgi:GNAT superfamily N-acetyltransferase